MIVPVKRAKIFVLKEQQLDVIKALQKNAILMVEKNDKPAGQNPLQQKLDRVNHLIEQLKSFKTKDPLFVYHSLTYDEFIQNNEQREEHFNQVASTLDTYEQLKKTIDEQDKYLSTYRSFQQMDMNPAVMKQALYAKFHTGYVHESKIADFESFLKNEEVPYQTYDLANEGKAVLFVSYVDEDESLMAKLTQFNFQPLELPSINENLTQNYQSVVDEKSKNTVRLNELKSQLSEYANNNKILFAFADYLKTTIELDTVKVLETESTHYIEGWVRQDEIEKLRGILSEVTSTFEIEIIEPTETDNPPTALKNNKFVTQFETITDMFSVPNPNELDPNPVMSIWYWIIFGIMMGDVGYGVIMVVLAGLYIKFMRPKGPLGQLVHIFYYTGFTSVIAGVLFGSLFGFSVDFAGVIGRLFNQSWSSTLIEPVNDPIPMLIFSLGFGVLHIFNGLIFKFVLLIKRKDYLSAFADVSSWMLVLIGVTFIALSLAFGGSIGQLFNTLGMVISILGATIVLLFAGRARKNIIGRLFSGIGALYGASGYLSDILSYSRILALSLSSAVIATTMNILADMVSGSFIGIFLGLIIYLIGHTFNLVMGLLSAYVHDGRLQYIEFFGKFYEGGGYRYEPFSIQTIYINEIITDEKGTK